MTFHGILNCDISHCGNVWHCDILHCWKVWHFDVAHCMTLSIMTLYIAKRRNIVILYMAKVYDIVQLYKWHCDIADWWRAGHAWTWKKRRCIHDSDYEGIIFPEPGQLWSIVQTKPLNKGTSWGVGGVHIKQQRLFWDYSEKYTSWLPWKVWRCKWKNENKIYKGTHKNAQMQIICKYMNTSKLWRKSIHMKPPQREINTPTKVSSIS